MGKVELWILAVAGLLCLVAPPIAWVYKPRSPEEYLALGPRKAALIKFINAAFPQLPTMLDALKQLALGAARTVVEEQFRKFPDRYFPPSVQDAIPTTRDVTRNPGEEGRASVGLLGTIAIGGILGLAAAYVLGCGGPARLSKYSLRLAACEEASSSCEAYVACAHRADAESGYPPRRLVCLDGGAPDAGSDAADGGAQ